jgi:hypothetical protein
MLGSSFVLLWWLAEWLGYRQEDRARPIVRDPLRLLVFAVRRLWKNRSFVGALLVVWLIGIPLYHVQRVRLLTDLHGRPPEAGKMSFGVPRLVSEPRTVLAEAPRLFEDEIPRALPDKTGIPLDPHGSLFLAAALAVGLIWMLRSRPSWLPGELRAGLRWPPQLVLAGCVLRVAQMVLYSLGRAPSWYEGMSYAWLRSLWPGLEILLEAVLLAPLWALLWHIGLQIARDERWNLRGAIKGMAATWAPIALLELFAYTPAAVGMSLSLSPLRDVHPYTTTLGSALGVFLALTPWIIVDRRVRLREAFAQTCRLLRYWSFDLLTFGLRFVLLYAALGVLLRALSPPGDAPRALFREVYSVPYYLLLLTKVVVIATLYLDLCREPEASEASAALADVSVPQ